MKRHAALVLDVLFLAVLAASTAAPALAQDRSQERYPARPIRLVIPSVPAGVHDVIGRIGRRRSSRNSAPSSSTIAAAAAA